MKDPDGRTTTFRYGGLHKVCEIRKPNGETTSFRYDREGRLIEVRNQNGDVHVFEHNAAGLLVREQTMDGRVLQYRYDLAGQVLAIGGRDCSDYPQDIEEAAQAERPVSRSGCGAAFSVDVDGAERLAVVQDLVKGHAGVDFDRLADDIRSSIARACGIGVHCIAFVRHGEVKKTSSGKLRRRHMRERYLDGRSTSCIEATAWSRRARRRPSLRARRLSYRRRQPLNAEGATLPSCSGVSWSARFVLRSRSDRGTSCYLIGHRTREPITTCYPARTACNP